MNKNNNNTPIPPDFFLYKDSKNYIFNKIVGLTQDKIAQLFGVGRNRATKHLKNIYKSGELSKEATFAKIAQVQTEGKRQVTRQIEFYNLDTILSVGCRINNIQVTHFKIWVNSVLKEYLIKEFVMNDERLKNLQTLFGKGYFKKQLVRIRDVLSSERRFYQKITDIHSQCSVNNETGSDVTKKFFASVQNKLHWDISKQTAVEIFVSVLQRYRRVSHEIAKALTKQEYDKSYVTQLQNYESDFDKFLKRMDHD
jgi:hypothetical protein bacD2_09628|uniref:RhuM family protein n=1 Tax=Bacteroides ovatus TaxID=28116 RepID=UPI00402A3B34